MNKSLSLSLLLLTILFSLSFDCYSQTQDESSSPEIQTEEQQAQKLFKEAQLKKEKNDYTFEALELAKKASVLLPEWGEPYLFIGSAYLSIAKTNCKYRFEKQAAVWAALDAWNYALDDPKTIEEATRLIDKFMIYCPRNADCFQQNLQRGEEYTIECLGVTTRVRFYMTEQDKIRSKKKR